MFPVRCFSCEYVISKHYQAYEKGLENKKEPAEILETLVDKNIIVCEKCDRPLHVKIGDNLVQTTYFPKKMGKCPLPCEKYCSEPDCKCMIVREKFTNNFVCSGNPEHKIKRCGCKKFKSKLIHTRLEKICCRRMFLSHVPLIDKLMEMPTELPELQMI